MLICSGLALATTSFAESGNYFRVLPMEGKCYGISDNGKWIISTKVSETSYLYNVDTEECIELLTSQTPFCEAHDVSDDGMVVGVVSEQPAYYKDGEWHMLDMPEGYDTGFCSKVSADGSVIYGNVGAGFYYAPVIWRDGVLENVNILAKDPFNKIPAGGYIVDQVSGDQSKMFGRVIDSQYAWYPVCWENGTPQHMFTDMFKSSNGQPNGYEMVSAQFSPNGRYIALDYQEMSTTGGVHYAKLYDFKNDEMTDLDGELICLVNDYKEAFSCSPASTLYRNAYVHFEDVTMTLENWLLSSYGLDLSTNEYLEYTGTPVGISADGKRIALLGVYEDVTLTYLLNLENRIGNGVNDNFQTVPTVISKNSRLHICASANAAVSVYDITGRAVHEATMGSNSTEIEVSKGTYVVRILQEGSVHTYKTIVE